MKKITVIIFIIITFSAFTDAGAQNKRPSAFASVKVYPTSVILNQPFKYTVSVFTETWFTKAPDVFDLQIPYSFTVSLGRPSSSYETIKGKRYTTLHYEYLIFPAKVGEMEVPAIPISFESPPEGDYKGVPINVKTQGRTVKVAGKPDNFTGEDWFVANSISVSQSWSRQLKDLKVGDVVERTITIRSSGTIAALIPEIKIDDSDWASIYTKTPNLSNSINDNVISSSRTERITYLLEKDGEYTIPEIVINYYNPQQKRSYQKFLKSVQLIIGENPDIAMLSSLQDSLNALKEQAAETESKEFKIFGLKIWQLLICAVTILTIIFLLIRTAHKINQRLKKRKEAYLKSELYQFKNFQRECRTNNYQNIYSSLVKWMDLVSPPKTTKGLINFTGYFEKEKGELIQLDKQLYGNPKIKPDLKDWSGRKFFEYFSKIRQRLPASSGKLAVNNNNLPDLNP